MSSVSQADLDLAHLFNRASTEMKSRVGERPALWSAEETQTRVLEKLEERRTKRVSKATRLLLMEQETAAQMEVQRDQARRENTVLKEHALLDALTELPNRRYFNQKLHEEVSRAERDKVDLGVAMMDLNYFKGVNDQFGHQVGDEILTIVGQELKKVLRESDFAARYGGDELALILPELKNREEFFGNEKGINPHTGKESIFLRINRAIGARVMEITGIPNFNWDPGIKLNDVPIYVSAGLAFLSEVDNQDGSMRAEKLVGIADQELYLVKGKRKTKV